MLGTLLALTAGYLFNRGLSVSFGLPRDGVKAWRGVEVASDLFLLLHYGISLAWLARVTAPERFSWIASLRVAPFFVTAFMCTGPVFSSLSLSGASLRSDVALDTRGLAISILGLTFVGCMVAWHMVYALRRLPGSEGIGYVTMQVALIATLVVLFCVGVSPPPSGDVVHRFEARPLH